MAEASPLPALPQLDSDPVSSLLSTLARYPLCAYCMLRLCNVRSSTVYTTSSLQSLQQRIASRLQPDNSSSPQLPSPAAAVCMACLDILPSLPTHVDALLSSADYASYTFTTFTLTISLPVTVTLRHLALVSQLSRAHPELLLSDASSSDWKTAIPCYDLKDACRAMLSTLLWQRTGYVYVSNPSQCSFEVKAVFTSACSAAEAELIARHTAGIERRRARKRFKMADVLTQCNLLQALPTIQQTEAEQLLTSYLPAAEQQSAAADASAAAVAASSSSSVNASPASSAFVLMRAPVLLMGSYLKYSRSISQTPWSIESEDEPPSPPSPSAIASASPPPPSPPPPSGDVLPSQSSRRARVRMTSTSVEEELVREVLPAFGCSSHRFSSSGREDLDVRMLGDGRPFCLELIQAKRVLDETQLRQLERSINGSTELVEVRRLRLAGREEFEAMKRGVDSRRKLYRCLVRASRALTAADLSLLSSSSPLTVQQRTPIRVLHRRSALTRPKVIHDMKAERVSEDGIGCCCLLAIVASSGSYIKEFVHGDRGRTAPSVSSLLRCRCDCLLLDVMGVRHCAAAQRPRGCSRHGVPLMLTVRVSVCLCVRCVLPVADCTAAVAALPWLCPASAEYTAENHETCECPESWKKDEADEASRRREQIDGTKWIRQRCDELRTMMTPTTTSEARGNLYAGDSGDSGDSQW